MPTSLQRGYWWIRSRPAGNRPGPGPRPGPASRVRDAWVRRPPPASWPGPLRSGLGAQGDGGVGGAALPLIGDSHGVASPLGQRQRRELIRIGGRFAVDLSDDVARL